MDRPVSLSPADPPAAVAPRSDSTRWLVGPVARYLGLSAQLTLFVAVVYLFSIESRAFLHLSVLTLAGFLIHRLLPQAWRLPFFLALSFAGIVLVMGAANAVSLIGIGLVLIGVCHLPIAFRWRAALLVLIGAALTAARVGLVPVPWSAAIWPILGSMFMFRLIVYLYDLQHDKTPASPVAAARLLLPAAERLLSAVSGRRLQDVPAHLLRRRRRPDLPGGRALDRCAASSTCSSTGSSTTTLTIAPSEVARRRRPRAATWSRTSCSTCASRASST